jgi:hypothetical protein
MSDIKRYELNPFDGECGMEEAVDGDFVKFEDHGIVVVERIQNALREAAIATCKLCAGGNKFVEVDPLQYYARENEPCRWFHRFSDTKEIATSCGAYKIHDLISKVKA